MSKEINLKIEIENVLDKNTPKINDLIRGFVFNLKELCVVEKYNLIGVEMK